MSGQQLLQLQRLTVHQPAAETARQLPSYRQRPKRAEQAGSQHLFIHPCLFPATTTAATTLIPHAAPRRADENFPARRIRLKG
ncbi:hypothetical protein ACIRG4_34030 [Streptomyces sp. NPDC102395]|uniref:hypothetical protein n=1 Tax=Streptomyces sp. NPDC102395 TaxID=3366168 RepID=UPI00380E46EF